MALQEETRVPPQFLPLSIVRAIWKRKLWVLSAWAIISVATYVVVMRLPAVYRAQSLILIEGQRIPERFVPTTVDDELSNRLSMLTQQIKSYAALAKTIEDFNLYQEERKTMVEEEIINMMRNDIEVQLVQGWGRNSYPAFTIAYQGSNPGLVARVADSLTKQFRDQNLLMREGQARGTQQFLGRQLEEARLDLEAQEERLSEFRQQYHGELPSQASALLGKLNRLEVQLKGVQDSLLNAEQQKMLLENSRSSAVDSLATFRELASQPGEVASARLGGSRPASDLEKAQAVLNSLLLKYSDDHPDVARQRSLVERLQQLDARAQAAQQAVSSSEASAAAEEEPQPQSLSMANMLKEHEDRIKNIDIQLSILEGNVANYERERGQILAEMAATQRRVEALPTTEQSLAKVVRNYDISRENYRHLLDKKNAADLASNLELAQKGERLVILDSPRVPSKPIKPKREMLISMGVAGGLAIGMLMGFGIELRRGVMLGEWELPEGSTVLGRIPPVKLAVAKRKHGFTPTESKRAPWPKARITLRLRSPGSRTVIAPTIVLCILGALVATSIYAGWSPF
jgi:polysaccharide chain length determinant protein (PEP-CTERM system associated)